MMSAKADPSNTTTTTTSQCDCPEKMNHHSILYTLLSSGTSTTTATSSSPNPAATDDVCQPNSEEEKAGGKEQEAIYSWDCTMRAPHLTQTLPTIIKLKHSEEVCPYAAQLLLKTVDFIRNLPAVLCLSRSDRVRLLQHCWSELLILTMAQCEFHIQVEKVSFPKDLQDNTTNVNNKPTSTVTSVARSCSEKDCREGALLKYIIATQGIPTTSDIDTLNAFFQKCQTLEIDDKEFAYLKSTIFFNPGKKVQKF
ncbi:nuclear receptor subfamily 0 group B member 1-like [Lytechinus pictus]|uniref:nuclear receptor subfamily 0 group B member 1-like n=1 Tax=Lytechinus pictus TaxID=7653 RepID=UPI00240CF19D|nr:nuclear receptor subfamily 0 group B member 1-like [Lytechinus pictus]